MHCKNLHLKCLNLYCDPSRDKRFDCLLFEKYSNVAWILFQMYGKIARLDYGLYMLQVFVCNCSDYFC